MARGLMTSSSYNIHVKSTQRLIVAFVPFQANELQSHDTSRAPTDTTTNIYYMYMLLVNGVYAVLTAVKLTRLNKHIVYIYTKAVIICRRANHDCVLYETTSNETNHGVRENW